ncbi:uncharacterized protein LY89DRAFT_691342 [Mollisia scopiformis]|uniref:Uncharacterized protein n=1 Tax=Mollisia scopiformis TaxID=149040 RepID=A0A132B7S8_MOLSC|nr:uncharacterized protein LY89DRAFT_691342 [Mollisia scopiformis]KUJ08039.1 hypothetical protein LY89DRAFT_691342 [Mollisia scopiformis]
MSSEWIAAWLAAQNDPNSPESDKIDHNEGFIEGFVPRQSSSHGDKEIASTPITKSISPGKLPSDIDKESKGKQLAGVSRSKQQSSRTLPKQKTNKRKLQEERDVNQTNMQTKRLPLGELSRNPTRQSQTEYTKAQSSMPRRRRHTQNRRKMDAENKSSYKITNLVSSTSKRNVSYDKRKEVPPTSSEPTTISPAAPKSTPPAAMRRKATDDEKGNEKEAAAAEPLSSQPSVHSPWRFLVPVPPLVPERR